MLQDYYLGRVREAAAARAQARARVRTRADLLRLQADVRRKLQQSFGPFPAKTPLEAKVTGQVRRPEYTIEKVIYHSRPGFPVTANLYLPRKAGPFPAVLGACGHSQEGKACDAYQSFSQNLARQGFAVLIYDPISQGERYQYIKKEGRAQPKGCCQEHNMAGNQMALLGHFFGLWRVWDGIRGLDYLLSRPEVDPTRVGVTGNSGGGTLSTYLTALDPRFTMAAPSCFVTNYLSNCENELPADSEQIPPGIIAAGLDMADFFVAHLPRPTLLLGQNNDFFDRRGLEATFEELRRLYAIAGAKDDIHLFIGPTNHGYSVHNREAMYRFFTKQAGVQAAPTEPRKNRIETVQTLQVTEKGQVVLHKARRVFDFTREAAQALAQKRGAVDAKALPALIQRALALPARPTPPHYRILRVRRLRDHLQSPFAVETEPRALAILHFLNKTEQFYHFPSIPSATLYIPHLSTQEDFLARRTPNQKTLLALDVRGMGQVTSLSCNDTDFFAPYGGDYFYNSQALMLAEPYAGRRLHDLLATLDLFQAHGCESLHLVGRGMGAVIAALAACVHPLVKRVTLHNALLSWHELTQTPVHSWPASAAAYGVLNHFDLPDCYRALAAKDLTLVTPWTSQMTPWRKDALRAHLKALGLASAKVRWE